MTVLHGGFSRNQFFNDTWEYDGRVWTARDVPGPAPRSVPVAGYDPARRVVVMHGGTLTSSPTDETWEYDGALWRLVSSNAGPDVTGLSLVYHPAQKGMVLLGGSVVWTWQGTEWTSFQAPTGAPHNRHSFGAVWDEVRNRIVMFGGRLAGSNGPVMRDTWEWDGRLWRRGDEERPTSIVGAAAAYDPHRHVTVLFGGSTLQGRDRGVTWEWDGSRWTQLDIEGPSARRWPAMGYDPVRRVMVLFGGTSFMNDTWEFNGLAWTRRATGGPTAREGAGLVYQPDRGVMVMQGGALVNGGVTPTWEWDGSTWRAINAPAALPKLRSPNQMVYDPGRGVVVLVADGMTWERTGIVWVEHPMPAALMHRHDPTITFDHNLGCVLLTGGYDRETERNTGDVWAWDGANWEPLGDTPAPVRSGHAMIFDAARGEAVMFGGSSTLGDMLFFNGTTWTVGASGPPTPRAGHCAAYDSHRGVTVMFGGEINSNFPGRQLAETWEWDGDNWNNREASGPSPRSDAACAFDENRGRLVLYGGGTHPNYLGDTWEWNGERWEQLPSGDIPPCINGSATYNPITKRVMLVGGATTDGWMPGTWEWDGKSWTQVSASAPAFQSGGRVAFDRARGVAVFVSRGGVRTWEWDGSAWTERMDSRAPSQQNFSMYFDSDRGQVVLLAGSTLWAWEGSIWERHESLTHARTRTPIVFDEARGELMVFGGEVNSGGADDSTWILTRTEPHFASGPADMSVCRGGSVELSVNARPPVTLEYTWRRNGKPLTDGDRISGARTARLLIADATFADSGRYECLTENACGAATSAPAEVTVCIADFNCDEAISSKDFFDFLSAFFDGDADVNADGTTNSQDFFDFLAGFFAEC